MSQSERQIQGPPADTRVQELRASAHLMTLETGTFCLVNGSGKPADGLIAGVRVSVTDPSDPNVTVASFRPDGWLTAGGDAALIRVLAGPAQVLVTIYQPAGAAAENAPKLRVLRLSEQPAVPEATAAAVPPAPTGARRPVMVLTEPHDIIAHIQRTGDTGRSFGEWVGTPGSQMAIEGFSLTAPKDLEPGDLSYQAVLGRGWMSPWSESGQFCGSRGMALPILGLRVKLSAAAAKRYALRYSATFLDGTKLEGLGSEDSCETPTLAALEAMRIELTLKAAGQAPAARKPDTAKAATAAKGKAIAAAPVKVVPKPAKGSKAASR
jgi:Clostridial hydrophobic W